jgi:tetratricopeptide (TPR) repeat protein
MLGLRSTARWALLAILAQLFLPARAGAADDSWRDRLARIHFDAGRKAYEAGHFEDAVMEFERGYQLAPRPLFLLNLAHLYLRLGRYEDVIATCEKYLASHPNDRLTREATELLTVAKAKKAQAATAPPPPVEEPKPQPPTPAPAPGDGTAVAPAPAPRHGPGRPKLAYTGVAALVVGGVALVTASALIGHASALNDDFNHPPPGKVYDAATIAQWEREQHASIGLFAAGGALVIAGGIMTAVGWRRPRDASAQHTLQLTPLVGRDRIGAALRISF